MPDRERRPEQQLGYGSAGMQEPDVDYVEAEHSPKAARLASLADLRRYAAESQSTKPSASELAYGPDDARGGHLKAPSAQISTGHPLVDKGLGCTDKPLTTPGCFLSPERRGLLLTEFHGRVLQAYANFLHALTELRVEELLKKEPEQSEWILDLLLDVIGHLGVTTVVKAFAALKGGALGSVQAYVADAGELSTAMSAESTGHLTAALGMAVTQGKAGATKKLGPQTDPAKPEEGTQKSANISYLSYLTNHGNLIYQSIREDVPAGLSDSLLLTLTDAYHASNHSPEVYKTELGGKLKRFEKSGVGKLGVTKNTESTSALDMGPWQWDTRAYWVNTPSGRRLGLYRREYREIPDTVFDGTIRHEASPAEKIAMEMQDYARRPFTFLRYVPVEFEQAAVAMHTAKWHTEPVERVAQTPEEIAYAGVTI